jgi:hypothetical protein
MGFVVPLVALWASLTVAWAIGAIEGLGNR